MRTTEEKRKTNNATFQVYICLRMPDPCMPRNWLISPETLSTEHFKNFTEANLPSADGAEENENGDTEKKKNLWDRDTFKYS